MTEVLTLALGREYTYAIYMPLEGFADAWARDLLRLQGFVPVPGSCSRIALTVDMAPAHYPQQQRGHHHKAPLVYGPHVVLPWRRRTGGCRRP